MLVKLLHDYGIIEKDDIRKRHYKPVSDLEYKRLRICGDFLLMEKIRHMHNRIYSVVTHPGKTEFVYTILQYLNQYQQGGDELCLTIHMLVMIPYNITSKK